MGNFESKFLMVCGSALKKKKPEKPEGQDEENSNFVARNRDGYFQKEDYQKIVFKFKEYSEWMDQSSTPSSAKEKQRHKKIKWTQGEMIGHGSFGKVIMGLNVDSGYMMAVKQVQIGAVNTNAQQDKIKALEVEIDLLSQFSHKNIVRYYGSERTKDTFNIFLEYISHGTIASLLERYGAFNETLIRLYTRQILQGLEYLHVRNTVHRDIKGANVLVDNTGVCKLTDFGTAKRISALVDGDSKYLPSIRGTINWMAPEVIKQTSLGRFCDIWSVGCTVIEMATGEAPWATHMKSNANSVSLLYQIAQAKSPPPFPKNLSPEAIDFLKQCFKINPQERPNVIKLLNHKFITGIENFTKQLDLPKPTHTQSLSPDTRDDHSHNPLKLDLFATKETRFHSLSPENLIEKKEAHQATKPPVHKKPSIYDFTVTLTTASPRSRAHQATKDERKSSISEERRNSRRDSLSKDIIMHTEEESKYTSIPSLKTIGQSEGSDPGSMTDIRSKTELPIIIGKSEVKRMEVTKPRMENRRNPDVKARMRPLGKNTRLQVKSGYANLSEDESISGASFLVTGSPGTLPEIGDDKGSVGQSSYRATSGNHLAVPNGFNGRVFQFPESVSQIEEENNKDWNVEKQERIEEEEEEREDAESEEGKRRIAIQERLQIYKIREEANESQHNVVWNEKNEQSRASVHSNPEVYGIDDLMENLSKKEKKSRESSALFKNDFIARDCERRSSIKGLKDDTPLQLHQIGIGIGCFEQGNEQGEGSDSVESLTVARVKSSPGMKKTTRQMYCNTNKYEMKENREMQEDENKKGSAKLKDILEGKNGKRKYATQEEKDKVGKFHFMSQSQTEGF